MKVGIIGLGYVGLTLAIAAADHGIDVYGVEINPHIRDCLREDRAHFYEPGLNALIKRHNNRTFHCVEKFPADVVFDAFVITVGTPLRTGEKSPDFAYITSALQTIKEVYSGDQLVILRSTVSVGTTREVVLPQLSALSGRTTQEVLVGMCPERTVEGAAVEELTHLPQIISGNSEQALEIAQRFFRHITPYVIPVSSLEEAELIKLYCNTYRDMTFAIGNAFCIAAQSFGVDGSQVIRHANQGYIRSNIAMPGFVAGPCLEKDAYILTSNMSDSISKDFILGGRRLNESLEDCVVGWVQKQLGAPSPDEPVVLSGMAFKGRPATSDLRGSPSVNIAKKLSTLGYTLRLHDYAALPEEMQGLHLGSVYKDLKDACIDAPLLLVLNNHRNYAAAFEDEEFTDNKRLTVLDVWGVCGPNAGVEIYTLGNLLINSPGPGRHIVV